MGQTLFRRKEEVQQAGQDLSERSKTKEPGHKDLDTFLETTDMVPFLVALSSMY